MTWLQLRLTTTREEAGSLEDLMLASGAVAVTLEDNADQPLLEPGVGETPLWNEIRLTGLYPADADMQSVLAHFPDILRQRCQQEILEDKDWEREWMRRYQPMQFGQRLWVCPSWLEPPDPGAVNLRLDPGLAFGTGTHPTTGLCLTQLEAMPLEAATVVDYGCGSGILAVAALKLGAGKVLAVDNDPQALQATRDNGARNAVDVDRLPTALPTDVDMQSWSGRADMVVANILAGPLLELSATLTGLLRPAGTLLLSGLLASQAPRLIEHYADRADLAVAAERDGWVCIRGRLR